MRADLVRAKQLLAAPPPEEPEATARDTVEATTLWGAQ
jgi:hypothetical protein